MDRCPICRARLKHNSECRRCGADLAFPIEMEKKAQNFFNHALYQISQGERENAKKSLQDAMLFHNRPLYQHLLNFINDFSYGKKEQKI